MKKLNSPLKKADYDQIALFFENNKQKFLNFEGKRLNIKEFKAQFNDFEKYLINLDDREKNLVWLHLYTKFIKFNKDNEGVSLHDISKSSEIKYLKWDNLKNGLLIAVILFTFTLCSYSLIQNNKKKEIANKIENVHKKGEFSSIKECLKYIDIDIPYEKLYVEDTPRLVWGGFDGTDGTFRCELVVTGSRGAYVEGTYSVPVSSLRQNSKNR